MIISGLKEGKRHCTANNAQNICNHNNYKTPERMNHSATEIASKLYERMQKINHSVMEITFFLTIETVAMFNSMTFKTYSKKIFFSLTT